MDSPAQGIPRMDDKHSPTPNSKCRDAQSPAVGFRGVRCSPVPARRPFPWSSRGTAAHPAGTGQAISSNLQCGHHAHRENGKWQCLTTASVDTVPKGHVYDLGSNPMAHAPASRTSGGSARVRMARHPKEVTEKTVCNEGAFLKEVVQQSYTKRMSRRECSAPPRRSVRSQRRSTTPTSDSPDIRPGSHPKQADELRSGALMSDRSPHVPSRIPADGRPRSRPARLGGMGGRLRPLPSPFRSDPFRQCGILHACCGPSSRSPHRR